MTPLFPPTIHTNGTSREELGQQQIDVLEAIRDLQAAMRLARPNGRDYVNGDACTAARDAWAEREVVVSNLYNEIEIHAMGIVLGGAK